MRKEFLSFGAPLIEEREIEEVVATLKSGWLTTGPKTHRFEEDFKVYTGAEHAVALTSCTAALHLSLIACGIQAGDEVIVPSISFAAAANVVVHCGARPVFADCDRETMNIRASDIEAKVTPHTKAVIVVHMTGRACDMDAIMAMAKKYKLKVIEDAAHAVETRYHGRHVGTIGDFGCYSFHAIKNVVTGEGGMVVTNDGSAAQRIRTLSLHGMDKDAWKRYGTHGYKHYDFIEAGYKYNMTDIAASLGLHQLARVTPHWERRDAVWRRYMEGLQGLPLILPASEGKDEQHARHLFTVLVDTEHTRLTRDELLDGLTKRNIGVGVHFRAVHLQPFYRKLLGHKEGDLPDAEWIGDRTASIPLSAKLTDADVTDVIDAVKDVFAHA